MRDRGSVIGVDLGGATFTVGVIGPDLQLIRVTEQPTPVDRPAADVLGVIARATLSLLAEADLDRKTIAGAGVALPGSVDAGRGRSRFAPNLPGWRDVPVRDLLTVALELPVVVDHDVRMATLSEYRLGAGRGTGSFVCVTVGTGIGAGIVIDGRLYRGASDSSGEIGHLRVAPGGLPCGCGQRGCLETVASGRAMAERVRTLALAGERTAAAGMSGGVARISAREVVAAAAVGDTLCGRVVDEALEALGLGLVTVVNVVNPDVIAVGGGVAQAGAWFFDRLRAIVQADAWPPGAAAVRLVPAALGTRAGVIGAGILATETFASEA